MAVVHTDDAAIVVSTLPSELGIDITALHAHDGLTSHICPSSESKSNTGLFDRRWNAGHARKRAEHPAARARLAQDPAWQLAPGTQAHIVMGLQVVWIDEQAKLYVTHYIYV
jgi:hypothetical protein